MEGISFLDRHQESRHLDKKLSCIGESSKESLISAIIPEHIRLRSPMGLPEGLSEAALARNIDRLGRENVVARCFMGQGYYGTRLPGVIGRNVLENPLLVHRLYALSVGDITRSLGGVVLLSDIGGRVEWISFYQCFFVG